MKITKNFRLKNLVTPLTDRRRPVYRWFLMKESFSSALVHLLADSWRLGKGDFVYDPFCGAGTVLLACQERGIDCLGCDVHPVLFFISKVKTREYEIAGIQKFANEILSSKFEKVEIDTARKLERVFPRGLLEDIAFFMQKISEIDREDVQGLLLLALRNAALRAGGVSKDGAVLRKSGGGGNLKVALKKEIERMIGDLKIFRRKECSTKLEFKDAREMKPEKPVSAIITSPPYLMKEEYISVYGLEEWLFRTPVQNKELFLNFSSSGSTLEETAERYFQNLEIAIARLFDACGAGARVCFVVSDGGSRDGVVEVCEKTGEIAKEVGFKVKKILVVNERWCTTPSRKKIGKMREALLFWEKKP
ncbi:MAG: hypothetical protein QW179_05065 [Candidatus Hadarchaeales archaeon]